MFGKKMDDTQRLIYNAVAAVFDQFDDIAELEPYVYERIAKENEDYQGRIAAKPFGRLLVREVFSQTSPQLITLSAHLVLEALLEYVIRDKFPNHQVLLKKTGLPYSAKVDVLYAKGDLTEPLFKDLRQLGRLRNRFAHDLFFDFGEFDISVFKDCEEVYKYTDWECAGSRFLLNLFLLRHISFAILVELSEQHPFLLEIADPEYKDAAEFDDDSDIPF